MRSMMLLLTLMGVTAGAEEHRKLSIYEGPVPPGFAACKSGPNKGKGQGQAKPFLCPEAQNTRNNFVSALKAQDWEKALSLCIPEVRTAATQYPTPESFFRAIVPLDVLREEVSTGYCSITESKAVPVRYVCLVELHEDPWVSWPYTVTKTDAGWLIAINLEPAEPLETVVAQKEAALQAFLETVDKVDRLTQNVTTRLTAQSNTFRSGRPIPLQLTLVNESEIPIEYDAQQVIVNGSLQITDDKGRMVPYTAGDFQTVGSYATLQPRTSVKLFEGFDIGKQYDLKRRGRYRVQFRGLLPVRVSPEVLKGMGIDVPISKATPWPLDEPPRDGPCAVWCSHDHLFPSNLIEIVLK